MPRRMHFSPEPVDLGNLPSYWQRVAELDERAHQAMLSWHTMNFTTRFLDEAQPAGHRTYIGVARLLNIAIDNQEAFQSLITTRGYLIGLNGACCVPSSRRLFTLLGLSTPEMVASGGGGDCA
jgi:hypothetical protein